MDPITIVQEQTEYPFYEDVSYQILAEEHIAEEVVFNNPEDGLINSVGFQLAQLPKVSSISPLLVRRIDQGSIIVASLATVATIIDRDALTPSTGDTVYVIETDTYYVWHVDKWGWFVDITPVVSNIYDYYFYTDLIYVTNLSKVYNKEINPVSFYRDVANDATRDLITASEGMVVLVTGTGIWYVYQEGAWQAILEPSIYGNPTYTQSLVQILDSVQTITDRDALSPTTGDFIYVLDTGKYYIYADSIWNDIVSTGPYEVGQNIDYYFSREILSVLVPVATQEDRDLLSPSAGDLIQVTDSNLYFIYDGSGWKLQTFSEIVITYEFNGVLDAILENDYRIDYKKNYAYLEVNSNMVGYSFEVDYWILPRSGYDNTDDINDWLANIEVPDVNILLQEQIDSNTTDISLLDSRIGLQELTGYDDSVTTSDLSASMITTGPWLVTVQGSVAASSPINIREGGIGGPIRGKISSTSATSESMSGQAIIMGDTFYIETLGARTLVTWKYFPNNV